MDSNQRIGESKSPALPLGYTPVWVGIDWPAQIPKAFLPDKLSAKRGFTEGGEKPESNRQGLVQPVFSTSAILR